MRDTGHGDNDLTVSIPDNAVIHMLQTTQQHHVQLSAMADIKANIVITASSVLLTLSIQSLDNTDLRTAVGTLSVFMIGALVFSVLAVLPKFRSEPLTEHKGRIANLLFFGDFARIDEDRYVREVMHVIDQGSPAIFEMQLNDIYQLGAYLENQKFRYLKWSYVFFLVGVVAAAMIQLISTVI